MRSHFWTLKTLPSGLERQLTQRILVHVCYTVTVLPSPLSSPFLLFCLIIQVRAFHALARRFLDTFVIVGVRGPRDVSKVFFWSRSAVGRYWYTSPHYRCGGRTRAASPSTISSSSLGPLKSSLVNLSPKKTWRGAWSVARFFDGRSEERQLRCQVAPTLIWGLFS